MEAAPQPAILTMCKNLCQICCLTVVNPLFRTCFQNVSICVSFTINPYPLFQSSLHHMNLFIFLPNLIYLEHSLQIFLPSMQLPIFFSQNFHMNNQSFISFLLMQHSTHVYTYDQQSKSALI